MMSYLSTLILSRAPREVFITLSQQDPRFNPNGVKPNGEAPFKKPVSPRPPLCRYPHPWRYDTRVGHDDKARYTMIRNIEMTNKIEK